MTNYKQQQRKRDRDAFNAMQLHSVSISGLLEALSKAVNTSDKLSFNLIISELERRTV